MTVRRLCGLPLAACLAMDVAAAAAQTVPSPASTVVSTPPAIGTLTGRFAIAASEIDLEGTAPSDGALALDLSGKTDPQTSVTVSLHRGPRQDVSSLFQSAFFETQLRLNVRSRTWNFSLGQVDAQSGAVAGPAARGNGVSVAWRGRRLVTDAIVARPSAFGQMGGGRLVRGSVDVRTHAGLFGVSVSDLVQPTRTSRIYPGVTSLNTAGQALSETVGEQGAAAVQELQPSDVADIVRLFSAANRVRGAGVQARLKLPASQQVEVHAGVVQTVNASEQAVSGPSGEVRYALAASAGTLAAVLRRMPESVPGISMPGDELSVRGVATLSDRLTLMGRAYHQSSGVLGPQRASEMDGTTAALQYAQPRWRLDLRANYRQSQFGRTRIRRTTSADVGYDLQSFTFDVGFDYGDMRDSSGSHPVQGYRGGVEWTRGIGWLSVEAGVDNDGQTQRTLDTAGSLRFGRLRWHAGSNATHDALFGSESKIWTALSIPLAPRLDLIAGLEHDRWDYGTAIWQDALEGELPKGPWRATIGLQRQLTVRLPFLGPGRRSAAARADRGSQGATGLP